jgi:hypothetical protein
MSLTDEQSRAYHASLDERPLEVSYRWPSYGTVLTAAGGVCAGSGAVRLVLAEPGAWMLLVAGLALLAAWWFGTASDGACYRRYNRARRRAIRQRLVEIGVPEADAKAAA